MFFNTLSYTHACNVHHCASNTFVFSHTHDPCGGWLNRKYMRDKRTHKVRKCACMMHVCVNTSHLLYTNALACTSLFWFVNLRAGANPRAEAAVEQRLADVAFLPLGCLGLVVVVVVVSAASPMINGVGGWRLLPHAWPVCPQGKRRCFSFSFRPSHLSHHVCRGRNVELAFLFAFPFSFCPARGGGRLNLGGACCGGFFFRGCGRRSSSSR